MILKTLDISQDPLSQGFKKHSYDLIVASLVLHSTPSLDRALRHVRMLLKPGGYLIASELLPTNYVHYGVMFGAFSGWWLGAEEGRIASPAVARSEWDNLLQNSGFSVCDYITPDSETIMTPMTVFSTQALDHRISFLRSPLLPSSTPFHIGVLLHDLAIVGGNSSRTSSILNKLTSLLKSHCERIRVYASLTDLYHGGVSSDTTVLSLVSLDQDLLDITDEGVWERFKSLLHTIRTFVWVTQSDPGHTPHSHALLGLVRSATQEIPSLDYFFLDIECSTYTNAEIIAQSALRYIATILWHSEGQFNITAEREMKLDSRGVYLIPRLMPSKVMNDRYNSSKKVITSISSTTDLEIVGNENDLFLQKSPLPDIFHEPGLEMEATHSIVSAVRVSEYSFMFLTIGKDKATAGQQVAFCTDNRISCHKHPQLAIPLAPNSVSEPWLLAMIAYFFLASLLIEGLSQSDVLLVYEADPSFAAAISSEAAIRGVEVIFFTTSDSTIRQGISDWNIPVHTTPSTVSQPLLDRAAVFINCEKPAESRSLGRQICSRIPSRCRKLSFDGLFNPKPWPPRGPTVDQVKCRLESSITRAFQYLDLETRKNCGGATPTPTVSVSELNKDTARNAVIDWTSFS